MIVVPLHSLGGMELRVSNVLFGDPKIICELRCVLAVCAAPHYPLMNVAQKIQN